MTYLVLYLIKAGLRPFVPRYLYLVSLEVSFSYFLAPLGYASLFLINDCPPDVCGELYEPTIRERIRAFGMVISAWPSSVVATSYDYVHNFQSAANVVLLYLSMALCVFPTVAHIGMLVVDVFRYILKRVCEGLMDVFDRLASGPAPVRRFLLGALSHTQCARLVARINRRSEGDLGGTIRAVMARAHTDLPSDAALRRTPSFVGRQAWVSGRGLQGWQHSWPCRPVTVVMARLPVCRTEVPPAQSSINRRRRSNRSERA